MDLSTGQTVYLTIIIIPGIILGVATIALSKKGGLWLIRFGSLAAGAGTLLSLLFGKDLYDVLLLIDIGGFGRAYIFGCMLILAGFIVLIRDTIFPSKNDDCDTDENV